MGSDDISVAGLLRDLGDVLEELRTLNTKIDKFTDHIHSLADNVLRQAASGEKTADQLLFTRQRLTEIYDQREYQRAGTDEILKQLEAHFARLQGDVAAVERTAREATGRFPLVAAAPPPPPERPAWRELLDAFNAAPKGLKVLLTILAILVAGHAELALFFKWLFGD